MARAFHEKHTSLLALILALVCPINGDRPLLPSRVGDALPVGAARAIASRSPLHERWPPAPGRGGPRPPPTTVYMTPSDGSDADFRRRFDEIIAEISPDEIHEILGTLMGAGSISGAQMPRPDLRRAPLGEPTILTVRMDLQAASPPISPRLQRGGDP